MQNRDEQAVEKLLQAYATQKSAKVAAAEEMKAIEDLLQQMTQQHPEWYQKCRTKAFQHGKLALVNRSQLLLENRFSAHKLYEAFPESVQLRPMVNPLRTLMEDANRARVLTRLGIKILSEEKLEIKLS